MQNVKVGLFRDVVWAQTQNAQLRVPTLSEAQDKVLAALLDTPLRSKHRNPLDWAVSLAIHAIMLAALVIAPLFFTQVLDLRNLEVTYLVAPSPPPPSPPPPLRASVQSIRPVKTAQINPSRLVAPLVIPRTVSPVHELEAPPPAAGVIGGEPGGVAGGVLNGIIGGTSNVPPPTPAEPAAKQPKEILAVGGRVKPPRELFKPGPNYPPLARMAHIQGTVFIEAIIDERGNVVNAKAMDGPGLLIPEAIRTVMLWKYEPTLLNGVAYPVKLTVTVNFAFTG